MESSIRQLNRWQYISLFPVLCLCVATLWLFSITGSEMAFPRHILKPLAPIKDVGEETPRDSSPSHENPFAPIKDVGEATQTPESSPSHENPLAPVQGVGEETPTLESSPSKENPLAPVLGVGEETQTLESSPSHKKISSQYQHPFLDQECYTYENLRARFICTDTHSFMNYSYEDILKCATNLWEATRNKNIRNPWESPGSSHRKPSARNAVDISKRPSVHLVMVGDSHIRNIYESFWRRMLNTRVWYRNSKMKQTEWRDSTSISKNWKETRHVSFHDLIHLEVPLRVTFYWDPLLQKLPELLSSWMDGRARKPTHLLLGSTLHYIKGPKDIFHTKGPKVASRPFYNHLKTISPNLKKFSRTAQIVFKFQDHLQVYSELVFDKVGILDFYNKIASDLLVTRGSSLVVWNSTVPLSDLYEEKCLRNGSLLPHNDKWRCYDPMHLGYIVLDQFLDMYLNDICSFRKESL